MGGVIAAGGPETAAAGAAMLRRGGNAVDAAVAAAFASFVAEVGVVHLGGSGLAHLYDARQGDSIVYDFFSTMPGRGRARPPQQLDFTPLTIDFGAAQQEFYVGRGSVAIPGNIFGLCRLATVHGRLPLAVLLEPAIRLARDGLAIAPFQAQTCQLLAPLYTHTPAMRDIFTRGDGRIIQPGDLLYIPDLAETLTALADEGEELLRSGALAQALLSDQTTRGGLLTAEDLTSYEVRGVTPIRLPYGPYTLLLPPPSSTGGPLIAFALKLLAGFPVKDMAPGSARQMRLFYEVQMATARARPFWEAAVADLGAETAVARFLDEDFVASYRTAVADALAGERRAAPTSAPRGAGNTSHLSVVDDDGLAVGLTTTAGETAGYVVPGTGFIPNNILGEADLNPAGFHRWSPGERIRTMMAPVIVLEGEHVRLVVGSGGSERIRSAILQVLSNVLDHGLALEEAVQRARLHVEAGVLQCEQGYDATAVDTLARQGYAVNRWPNRSIYFGGVHSVARAPDGALSAAGDNRRGGAVERVVAKM